MKKSMKKFMITCMAVSAIAMAAGMSAMAADITPSYDAEGKSVPITVPAETADGTQMTVLVVPTAKKASVTEDDILYIAQASKGSLPAKAKLMSSRVADGEYSLLVGYYNDENTFSIAEDTFTIGAASASIDVLVGDADRNGKITSADGSFILTYVADEDGIDEGTAAWYAAAYSDAIGNTKITSADASAILTYIADEYSETVGETVTLTLD